MCVIKVYNGIICHSSRVDRLIQRKRTKPDRFNQKKREKSMIFFNRAIVSSFITAITISDTRFRLTDGTFRIRDRRSGFSPGFGERVHKYEVFFTTGSYISSDILYPVTLSGSRTNLAYFKPYYNRHVWI